MTTWLHEERIEAALAVLRESGARSVLDLGCGEGDLLVRLAQWPQIERLTGLDICRPSLERARHRLADLGEAGARVVLVQGSMTEAGAELAGYDCALLIETIEHLDPARLSDLERAVFARMRPGVVAVSTPNAEFNTLLGVPAHRFRHPGHRFEWGRARFRRWAEGVGTRHGYAAAMRDVGGRHPTLGGASQMAVFTRVEARGTT